MLTPMQMSSVGWRDYQGLDGVGQGDMADLQKALTAGHETTSPGAVAGDGFALRPESLEQTLKTVTFQQGMIKFFRALVKLPAYNTVEEFTRLVEYGSGQGAFIDEGDLPESDDSTYERAYVPVKFMGVTRSCSHVMNLVRSVGIKDQIAQETVNGTFWLLRQIERALFAGDSSMIPLQFDGLFKLIIDGAPGGTSANVIDMRGLPMDEQVINDGAQVVQGEPNYGMATDLYMPDGAYADLSKGMYPAVRFPLTPAGFNEGMVGVNIKGFYSSWGPIAFNPDVFMQFGPLCPGSASGAAAKRPSTPTESIAPAAAGTAAPLFTASDAGDYIYKVCAINRYGRSAPVTMTTVTVAATQTVTMTVADGATTGTAFEVSRTGPDGAAATAAYAFSVARTGVTQLITDTNAHLPGTAKAALIQQNVEFCAIKQLAPMLKLPLAMIDTSIRWMMLIYLALAVYAPGKGMIYTNVGRAPGSAGTGLAGVTSLLTGP